MRVSMTPRAGAERPFPAPPAGGVPRAKMAQALSAEEFQRMQVRPGGPEGLGGDPGALPGVWGGAERGRGRVMGGL